MRIDSADLLAETLLNAEARNQVGPYQADAVRQTYEQALHCWFGNTLACCRKIGPTHLVGVGFCFCGSTGRTHYSWVV